MDWPCFQNKVVTDQEESEEKTTLSGTPQNDYVGSNPNIIDEKQEVAKIIEPDNDKTTNTKEEAVGLNAINDICVQTDETLILGIV